MCCGDVRQVFGIDTHESGVFCIRVSPRSRINIKRGIYIRFSQCAQLGALFGTLLCPLGYRRYISGPRERIVTCVGLTNVH